MKHILINATEGLVEPWIAYKDGELYYSTNDIIIEDPSDEPSQEPMIVTKYTFDGASQYYDTYEEAARAWFNMFSETVYKFEGIDNYYTSVSNDTQYTSENLKTTKHYYEGNYYDDPVYYSDTVTAYEWEGNYYSEPVYQDESEKTVLCNAQGFEADYLGEGYYYDNKTYSSLADIIEAVTGTYPEAKTYWRLISTENDAYPIFEESIDNIPEDERDLYEELYGYVHEDCGGRYFFDNIDSYSEALLMYNSEYKPGYDNWYYVENDGIYRESELSYGYRWSDGKIYFDPEELSTEVAVYEYNGSYWTDPQIISEMMEVYPMSEGSWSDTPEEFNGYEADNEYLYPASAEGYVDRIDYVYDGPEPYEVLVVMNSDTNGPKTFEELMDLNLININEVQVEE